MISVKPERPYFDAWRRRTGRRLAASGRISQLATVLAHESGGSTVDWRDQLRRIMQGDEIPSLDLLTRIDSLLIGPPAAPAQPLVAHQTSFF